jgi:integrase
VGTIQARRRKDGTTGYTATIRLKAKGVVIYGEAQTFDKKALAQEWMRRREADLDQQRARGQPQTARYTVGELIIWYRDTVGPTAEWSRSKAFDLARLLKYPISGKQAHALTPADYIAHVEQRRSEGAGPATAGNDLVWIGQVLRSARPSLHVAADLGALEDARHELRSRKLIAKSKWRDRRVSKDEERKLLDHLDRRDGRAIIPMLDIVQFALATSRRQEEITRLRWADLDRVRGIAWLDDVKHPTRKKGNRRSFRMLESAWEIIERQPRGERVFPYNPKSIGEAFRRACKFAGIVDLCFHDLRHEATSRLFEKGYAIQEVAQFTLHESWQTLKRYTHLRPEHVAER